MLNPIQQVNALTVDVEDYFQVSAFAHIAPPASWHRFESRVCANTEAVLELFDRFNVRGTFFVLGWIAERFPSLVRTIADAGHEVASHGYCHRLVYDLSVEEFREDLRRARAALESASGQPVLGYRAPSFSITRASEWAFDVLIEEGYAYDASVFPIRHDRYGVPDSPRHPYLVTRPGGTLWEMPASTVRMCGMNLPIAGGGYFRLFPFWWTRHGIARLNRREQRGAIFYVHPWELDPAQPVLPVPLVKRLRHYGNLAKTKDRLQRLLAEFPFAPIVSLLEARA